jgi:hypothetical protein
MHVAAAACRSPSCRLWTNTSRWFSCRVLVAVLPFLGGLGCSHPLPLIAEFNSKGVISLRYNGWDYVGYGDFRTNVVHMVTPSGGNTDANLDSTVTYNPTRKEFTRKYDWGTLIVRYALSGSRLDVSVVTHNTSPNTISGISYEVLGIKFPTKPAEYDGVTPMFGFNVGDPTILKMTHGPTVLYITNRDAHPPLLMGFPWALNKPASTLFPLRINTDRDPMYPDSLPTIHRPIPPQSSDTYRVSLSFGPSSAMDIDLARQVYRDFSDTYPSVLRWTDRRPIGQLIIATPVARSRTNPRGWFNDPSLDVTTPAGLADFRRRMLAWADRGVSYLQNLKAQGMVTWDIEGEEFLQPISYIGDPRLVGRLAPEMTGVVEAYFKKFTDAGFRVGVCIRPQQLAFSASGAAISQRDTKDVENNLSEKIRFARDHWGATLFYIDSNGNPGFPLDVQVIRSVAKAFPDVLLIPEHSNLAYYSASAPYAELRRGVTSTPVLARRIYKNAFSVISVTDGPIDQSFNQLGEAVKQGDSLFARAWFADPTIDKVTAIYNYSGK